MVLDQLQQSAARGGALAGVMLWNAALAGSGPDEGYNLYLDADGGYSPAATAGRRLRQLLPSPSLPTPSPLREQQLLSSSEGAPASGAAATGAAGLAAGGPRQHSRRLQQSFKSPVEQLDAFRRGPQRQACQDQSIASGW